MINRIPLLLSAAVLLAATPLYTPTARAATGGELANIKVVTDANPDYSDMESMVRSITSNWATDEEKMYALFYWDHLARRQTSPMMLHGFALTDPIRQYNDYGFTMCSTISGIKCSTWNYMGYPCRYFDISNHTVPDVWYNGKYHHYDDSLSMMYTLPDGKTIAAVPDIGATMAGPETDGKPVKGYIALYHALTATSPNGFCEGADTPRPLSQIVEDFNPGGLKYRYYLYDQDRGHRYILNLRDGEVYTRYYSRQDANSPNAVELDPINQAGYKADPAYYVPNSGEEGGKGTDPELTNPRYHIRGNGDRTWAPLLDDAHLPSELYSSTNIKAANGGLAAADPAKPAEAVFKVEVRNVITSLKIHAQLTGSASAIAISTTNGLQWKDVWTAKQAKAADGNVDLKLLDDVNGSYSVLVKVTIDPAAALKSIAFDTLTEINAHTQPTLHLGKNTVYVGNGDQSESIVFWPELPGDRYKPYAFEEKNVVTAKENNGYLGSLYLDQGGQEGYVVFKVDAPTDITSVTYGGRLYNRAEKAHIDFLHSFDGGKTWKQDYSLTDTKAPWDVIHYETVTDIPPGTKSVLFKYSLNGPGGGDNNKGRASSCSLYAVRMEVDHKLPAQNTEPLEVTYTWQERHNDYSTTKRSHTQIVDKLPATYTIDVGGDDQPIVDSLALNLLGSRPDVKPGYSDGKDVAGGGGEKFVGFMAHYGNDIAVGKSYTYSVPPAPKASAWGAEDPDMKKLTDGRVGADYTGGSTMADGAIWSPSKNPEITIDLGQSQKCAAFRIHTNGYPYYDAIKGTNKDHVEVLVSTDGKDYKSVGKFNFNLHWKDIPINYIVPDDETFCGYNFTLPLKSPVDARYVKYKVSDNQRSLGITELQVLDSYSETPFDLKIALPDPAQNGKAPPKPDTSPNAKQWKPDELPTDIGKEQHFK